MKIRKGGFWDYFIWLSCGMAIFAMINFVIYDSTIGHFNRAMKKWAKEYKPPPSTSQDTYRRLSWSD